MSQKNPKSPKSPGGLEIIGKGGNAAIKLEDIDLAQLAAVSVPIRKRINALKNDQLKLLDLEKQFFEELHQLECKYAKLYEPIYEKRKKIVVGEVEPTDEESKWALDDKEDAEEGEDKKSEEASTTNGDKTDESKLTESGKKLLSDLKAQFETKKGSEKGIPNFWLETLQAFRITAEMIQEHDEAVLAFLQDIRVKMHDQKPYGYTIEFEFAENPYFTNKVLTKSFELKMDVDSKDPFSYDGPDLERCTGCKIDWKPNKNVTVRLTKKKIKGRNKKAPPKVVTKEEKQESFFVFFETRPELTKSGNKKGRNASESSDAGKQVALKNKSADEDNEDEDDDEMDEETARDLYLMTEFEIGQYLKDKIIPKAVLYFTGELDDMDEEEYDDGEDYDDEDEDDDDDDENEDEDDDDEDDDDDDDDDDHPKGQKKGGAPGGGGKGGKKGGKPGHHKGEGSGKPGEPTPSECKQN